MPLTSDDAPKRAVIYCRMSLDRTGEARGVDRQEAACRALATARGWEVVGVITENSMSATTGKRPGYHRMLADARAGDYEVIIAWATDRLTRSMRELEDLIDLSEQTGVLVATCSGDLDLTTDQGRTYGRVLAAMARGEVERKSARQKAAFRQSAERGEQPSSRAFGYRADGTVDPVEAPVVREMFARFVAGQGATSLAPWINGLGFGNTQGKPWTSGGVSRMLRNPRYVAERWRVTRDRNNRQVREYVCPGDWEPILDAETFAAAQARIGENRVRYPYRGGNKKHLGAGLLVCSVCGDPMGSYWRIKHLVSGQTNRTLMYACRPSMHLVRRAEPVDELVARQVVARLRRRDVVAALLAQDENAHRERELTERAVGLRGSLAELAEGMALPKGHADYLSPALAGRAEQRIMAELAEIETKLGKQHDRNPLSLVAGAADPGQAWLELRVSDLRAAQEVAKALVTITVLPGKPGRSPFDPSTVSFDWREPVAPLADEQV